MGIPDKTVVQLGNSGIMKVDNLVEFDKYTIQQVAYSLQCLGGRILDPTPNVAPGAKILTPPFIFGAKSQKQLLAACEIVQYCETNGRSITTANILWNTVIKNFEAQWKMLKERKKGDNPDVPNITKALPVIKWTQAFGRYLDGIIGHHTIPLSYVIREEITVPVHAPPLIPGQPHSEDHGSVESELVAGESHTHALYCDDKSLVYYKLEEATLSTPYAESINPFQCPKYGRASWLSLNIQYSGQDKW